MTVTVYGMDGALSLAALQRPWLVCQGKPLGEVVVETLTVHYERVRLDAMARIASTESMLAHLERLGEQALAVAAEMDIERDEVSAEWLTARFSRAPLTVQRRRARRLPADDESTNRHPALSKSVSASRLMLARRTSTHG